MVLCSDVFGIADPSEALRTGSFSKKRGTVKDDPRATKFPGWPARLFGIAALAGIACSTPEPRTAVPFRFPIELPDSVGVANGLGIKLGLSRDGSQLAIVGMKEGRRAIYLRRSDEVNARLVAGTDSGFSPSFSPDGQWLLFLSGGRLLKVRVAGGAPEPVVDSAVAASWGDDDAIIYQKGNAIWRVSATGADPKRIATPDASKGYRRYGWPEVLPGSKHALITVWRGSTNLDSARIAAISLSDGTVTDLGVRGVNAHYAGPGHILFAQPGGLVAAIPFSLGRLATTGEIIPLLQNVWAGDGGGTDYAAAENGVLAYHGGLPDADQVTMISVDRAGNARALPQFGREEFREPRLSPDGRHMAVAIGPPPPARTGDIWVYDLATGQRKQVSTRGVNQRPEWTTDGSRVVFISQQGDSQFVISRRSDASGEPEILARGVSPAFFEVAMGPARGWSAVRTGIAPGGIRVAPTDSFSQLRTFETKGQGALTPRVSPNGRLIAYVAMEAGRREVFVRPVAGQGGDVAVSREGGSEPAWSPDGSTLYFRGLTNLMSASISERNGVVAGTPVTIFADTFKLSVAHTGYDVFPSGREFLMLARWSREQANAYVVVNWQAGVRHDGERRTR
jgi:Tol biopolymer transport system component